MRKDVERREITIIGTTNINSQVIKSSLLTSLCPIYKPSLILISGNLVADVYPVEDGNKKMNYYRNVLSCLLGNNLYVKAENFHTLAECNKDMMDFKQEMIDKCDEMSISDVVEIKNMVLHDCIYFIRRKLSMISGLKPTNEPELDASQSIHRL